MGKLTGRYTILNPKELFEPNDEIEGIYYLENEEEKDKKLKFVRIHLDETYDYFQTKQDQKTGEVKSGWHTARKTKVKEQLAKGDLIRSGETKEYPFKITLPSKWKVRTGGNYKDWHLSLDFRYKTGLKSTTGEDKFGAHYVIPVKGNQVQSYDSTAETGASSDDMKFCSECGKKIKRATKFCEHCGAQS